MKECLIVLPARSKDGTDLEEVHADIIEALVRRYNNVRAGASVAFFRNPTTEKFEDVDMLEYRFGVTEHNLDFETGRVKETVKLYGAKCEVSHVYATLPDGDSCFIEV